jgi:hypothetical protein
MSKELINQHSTEEPDPHYPYLSKEDYAVLTEYKHFQEKTMIELWVVQNLTNKIEERILPQDWSANKITMVGNSLPYISTIITFYYGGLRFHEEVGQEPLPVIPAWVILFAAFSCEWFSIWDMMDGARARRLKAGSPIGRIID